MKILFLSHYFPPEVNAPATRTYEHCKQWVRNGHEVTVVTCVPNHPMGEVYPGYRNKLVHVEFKDGIKVIRLLTYVTANEGFLKRTFNYVFYMLMCIFATPFLSRPDVVISTSPQFFNGLAGYVVSRLRRRPWILEIRDLWPESILAVGAIKNPTIIRFLEWLERFAYRKANHVVCVTEAFKKHIAEHGGDAERITVIRNGVDLSFFQQATPDADYAKELGVEGKFVAAYVGTHGMAHGLDVLLYAAEKLKNRTDIVLLTAGDGAERKRLLAERDRRGLNNLLMLGQLPKSDMPRLWSITNVSLVLLKDEPLFLTVIPSKIFESMAMGKPIIHGVRGESLDIVLASGAGVGITPENAEELATQIQALADNAARYQTMSEEGPRYVAANFDRTVLAERFEELLGELVR